MRDNRLSDNRMTDNRLSENRLSNNRVPEKHARRQRRHAGRRARRLDWRPLAFGVIALLVLGAAAYLLIPALFVAPLPASDRTIDIAAGMDGFDLQEIRVKAGETVTVRLRSLDTQFHTDGGGKHQWAVDELGLDIVAPPKGTNTVTFTADKPGTYTYYCDICCGGRANPSMQGTLVVEG